jgi:hypothetical protein
MRRLAVKTTRLMSRRKKELEMLKKGLKTTLDDVQH